jgi:hypothetical protein
MCRTSRAGTSPGGDIRRTRVQAAKDRMHAMRIGRASGTVPPRHRRVEDALPYVPGRKGPLSSRSVEQCGHGGPSPSRDGSLGGTVSPRALKYIVHRGLRLSRRAFARPIFPVAEDGDSPGWPELQHERGTVGRAPPWESPNQGYSAAFSSLGGTASSRSARKARPRTLLRNLQRDSNGSALASSDRSGRYGVPAVRKSIGRRGLRPSRKVPWEGPRPRGPQEYRPRWTMPLRRHSHAAGYRAESAKPGWAASWRSARKGRTRAPLQPLQPHPMAGCPCELDRLGGTASPPSATIQGTKDCAPPTGSHGRDRVPAVRKERQTTGASTEPATTPGGRMPLRTPPGREGPRPRRPQQFRAQRTAPLPDIVQPWPSFDIGQPGRDRVLAVRWKRPVIACQSQAGVPATRLVAAAKRLRDAFPDTNRRHRDCDMLCAVSFGRSPCPLCLSGSIPPCLWTDRTGCRGRCGRR